MSPVKVVAILLIAAGVAGLVYGGFTYTKATHGAKLGPIELQIKDREKVRIPVGASVAAIVVGVVLLAARGKR